MILSDAAIRNRVTILVLVVLIVFAGVYSYVTLPREAAPDVDIPIIIVLTTWEGASPQEVADEITDEIESELEGLEGLDEITSTSAEGLSSIKIEFLPDVDIDDALQRVKDKVDLAERDMPRDEARKEPVIQEINVSEFPILTIALTGEVAPVQLKRIADRFEDAVEALPGVLGVDVLGTLEHEVRVEFDPDRVAAYGLSLAEVQSVIPGQHVNVSAGGLDTAPMQFTVRLQGEFDEARNMSGIVVAYRDDRPIYLRDVATVRNTFKDRQTYSRLDGQTSVTVAVKKRIGANIVEIAEQVKAIMASAQELAPATVRFAIIDDQSDDIDMMVKDLENNIVSGLILVLLVLVLFLGPRTSVIVALAIPLSMLVSFAVLQALGITLNMIVLFSLILSLGMLVDNAIVIVENITRHLEMGYGRIEAARRGTAQVAWPVITSTATTVAAFTPMMFWPGTMGDFMKYLPITVVVTLSSSLFVAMIINPVIASVLARPRKKERGRDPWLIRGYRALLCTALDHRRVTLLLAMLVLVGIGAAFMRWNAGVELFPQFDPRRAIVNLRGPQGTNVDDMDELARRVERRIEPFRTDPTGHRIIEHVVANVGSASDQGFGLGQSGPHIANLTVVFVEYEDRHTPSGATVRRIREALSDLAGAEVKVEKQEQGPPTGAPVTVRLQGRGESYRTLERLSDRARQLIEDVPNLVNLRSDLETARPELRVETDLSRSARFDLNNQIIGNFLKMAIYGQKVASFRIFDDDYDVTVRYPERFRDEVSDLQQQTVPNPAGQPVHYRTIGRLRYVPGMGQIHHVDGEPVVTLTADAEGRLDTAVLADVQDRLDELGYSPLLARDLKDPAALCRRLVDAEPGTPAGRVWEMLAPDRRFFLFREDDLRGVFRDVAAAGAASDKQRDAIVAAINQEVIPAEALYAEEAFAGVEPAPELRGYLDRGVDDLSEKELARRNRLLLEANFPELIVERQRLELPPDYRLSYAGQREEQEKASQFLFLRALPIALLTIVLILVTQFNTLSAPLIIMTTVLLSTIGVFIGLLVFRMPFGIIMTGVGVISLAGVVVNNAIVLLAYTRELQQRGREVVEAAVQAGQTRLRPVLLTAVTTILGLVPMATGVSFNFHTFEIAWASESSQWWASMAIAVIFGLLFATVLTLVVVPSLYVALYRVAQRFGLGGIERPSAAETKPQPVLEDY